MNELFIVYAVGNYEYLPVEIKATGKGIKLAQLTTTDSSKGEHGLTTFTCDCQERF